MAQQRTLSRFDVRSANRIVDLAPNNERRRDYVSVGFISLGRLAQDADRVAILTAMSRHAQMAPPLFVVFAANDPTLVSLVRVHFESLPRQQPDLERRLHAREKTGRTVQVLGEKIVDGLRAPRLAETVEAIAACFTRFPLSSAPIALSLRLSEGGDEASNGAQIQGDELFVELILNTALINHSLSTVLRASSDTSSGYLQMPFRLASLLRDIFRHCYEFESESAYRPSNRLVLARMRDADNDTPVRENFDAFFETLREARLRTARESQSHIKSEIAVAEEAIGVSLRKYQVDAIEYMIWREQNPTVTVSTSTSPLEPREIITFDRAGSPTKLILYPGPMLFFKQDEPEVEFSFPGGIIADEMGLGKTLEVIGLIASNPRPEHELPQCVDDRERIAKPEDGMDVQRSPSKGARLCTSCQVEWRTKDAGWKDEFEQSWGGFICPVCVKKTKAPFPVRATLIVVPVTLLEQWHDELVRHVRSHAVRILTYRGLAANEYAHPAELASHDVVLTSYETLMAEHQYRDPLPAINTRNMTRRPIRPTSIFSVDWWRVVADESQQIGGVASKLTAMLMGLSTRHRWCCTGTPLTNSIADLAPSLGFVAGDRSLARREIFERLFLDDRHQETQALVHLLARVFWRNAKKDVHAELNMPRLNVCETRMQLEGIQQAAYEELLRDAQRRFATTLAKMKLELETDVESLTRKDYEKIIEDFNSIRVLLCTMNFAHAQSARPTVAKRAKKDTQPFDIHACYQVLEKRAVLRYLGNVDNSIISMIEEAGIARLAAMAQGARGTSPMEDEGLQASRRLIGNVLGEIRKIFTLAAELDFAPIQFVSCPPRLRSAQEFATIFHLQDVPKAIIDRLDRDFTAGTTESDFEMALDESPEVGPAGELLIAMAIERKRAISSGNPIVLAMDEDEEKEKDDEKAQELKNKRPEHFIFDSLRVYHAAITFLRTNEGNPRTNRQLAHIAVLTYCSDESLRAIHSMDCAAFATASAVADSPGDEAQLLKCIEPVERDDSLIEDPQRRAKPIEQEEGAEAAQRKTTLALVRTLVDEEELLERNRHDRKATKQILKMSNKTRSAEMHHLKELLALLDDRFDRMTRLIQLARHELLVPISTAGGATAIAGQVPSHVAAMEEEDAKVPLLWHVMDCARHNKSYEHMDRALEEFRSPDGVRTTCIACELSALVSEIGAIFTLKAPTKRTAKRTREPEEVKLEKDQYLPVAFMAFARAAARRLFSTNSSRRDNADEEEEEEEDLQENDDDDDIQILKSITKRRSPGVRPDSDDGDGDKKEEARALIQRFVARREAVRRVVVATSDLLNLANRMRELRAAALPLQFGMILGEVVGKTKRKNDEEDEASVADDDGGELGVDDNVHVLSSSDNFEGLRLTQTVKRDKLRSEYPALLSHLRHVVSLNVRRKETVVAVNKDEGEPGADDGNDDEQTTQQQQQQGDGDVRKECPVCYTSEAKYWLVSSDCAHTVCGDCFRSMLSFAHQATRMPDGRRAIMCVTCRRLVPEDNFMTALGTVKPKIKRRQKAPPSEPVDYTKKESNDPDEIENQDAWADEPLPMHLEDRFTSKMAAVVRRLRTVLSADRSNRCLVFTGLPILNALKATFLVAGFDFVTMHTKRETSALNRFRTSKTCRIAVMPVGLGARGLNLTEANHVLFVEPQFDFTMELQAIGRIDRIGQQREMWVHHFVVEGTVEQELRRLNRQEGGRRRGNDGNIVGNEENNDDGGQGERVLGGKRMTLGELASLFGMDVAVLRQEQEERQRQEQQQQQQQQQRR